MKAAVVFLGCLLVLVAVTNVAQSKAIQELETRDVTDAQQGVHENLGLEQLADKIVAGLHQLVERATEDTEATKGMDLSKIINQAKRLAEVIQIIKTRDIGAGIELLKKIISEFLGH